MSVRTPLPHHVPSLRSDRPRLLLAHADFTRDKMAAAADLRSRLGTLRYLKSLQKVCTNPTKPLQSLELLLPRFERSSPPPCAPPHTHARLFLSAGAVLTSAKHSLLIGPLEGRWRRWAGAGRRGRLPHLPGGPRLQPGHAPLRPQVRPSPSAPSLLPPASCVPPCSPFDLGRLSSP